MRFLRPVIHRLYELTGYQLVKTRNLGHQPMRDMRHFLPDVDAPVILDVGAHQGESVENFRKIFPQADIHSFEPSPATYQLLQHNTREFSNVKTWNVGVGAQTGVMPFLENTHSYLSSFLPPGETAWGSVDRTTDVPVVTIDSFAEEHALEYIHILKSDAQGFDFEVFKGCEQLMREDRIGLVFFETIFSRMYEGRPAFDETLRYLLGHNFELVAFYKQHFQNDLLSWSDALFINKKLYAQHVPRKSKR